MHRRFTIIYFICCCLSITLPIKFPIKNFFNITESSNKQFNGSLKQFICNGSSNGRSKCCECDSNCMRYRTCCIDKLWDKSNPLPIETYLDTFLNETRKYKDFTCEPLLTLPKNSEHESEKLLMVSTCLPTASRDDIAKCINNINLSSEVTIPVLGFDKYLYKSSFCAKCNFIHQFEIVNITANCKGPETNIFRGRPRNTPPPTTKPPLNRNLLTRFTKCAFRLVRNSRVTYSYVSVCRNHWSSLNKNCHKSSRFYKYCKSYTGRMAEYTNYHCYKCNTENSSKDFLPIGKCPTKFNPSERGVYSWSFTIIFGSDTKVQVHNINGNTGNENQAYCGVGEMLDVLKGTCKKLFCPPNYKVVRSACTRSVKTSTYSVSISNPAFDSSLVSKNAVLYVIPSHNNITISKFVETFQIEMNTSSESFISLFGTNITVLKRLKSVTMKLLSELKTKLSNKNSNLWLYAKRFYVRSLKKEMLSKLYGFDISRTFPHDGLCAVPITFDGSKTVFFPNCSANLKNRTLHRTAFISWIVLEKKGTFQKISTCSLFHLQSNCGLHLITSNYIIDANKTLTYKPNYNKSLSLAVGEYLPLPQGIGVCLVQVNHKMLLPLWHWLKTVRVMEYYISIIGTSTSIICYMWIIATYLSFKELRNIPALNTIAFSSCLLLADVSFIIATEAYAVYDLCKAIGIILHWSLLTAQMWVIVIAIDLASKFGVLTIVSREINRKLFVRYCIFAFIVPTVIVLITLLLNETSTSYIGYGDHGVCWIKNFNARILSYIVPISIGFVLSVATIVFTIYKIRLAENESKQVLSQSGRNKVNISKIALKLVVILGVTEMLGFIQIRKGILTENEQIFNSTFSMAYTLLRSFRGMMLWFVYIFNSRILDMYKQYLRDKNLLRKTGTTGESMKVTSVF